MDSKTNAPSFTVSLRGYDRMEVDEYLDSLAEALGQVEDAQEQNRRLQGHISRLNTRIRDLEDRISADTPRTGSILAERIGILLRDAEEAASDTIERAGSRAAELVAEADRRLAEAEEAAGVAVAGGQEQARRIEAGARAEAAEIISEAEARAAARTRQIEQWAEQVVSHTRAEEARMLREQQAKRDAAMAELRSLAEQRDTVAATLAELRETLGQALGLVVPPAGPDVELVSGAAAAELEVAPTHGAIPAAGSDDRDGAHHPDEDTSTAPELSNGALPHPVGMAAVTGSEDEGLRAGAETGFEVAEDRPAAPESLEAGDGDPEPWWPATDDHRPPFDGEAADDRADEPVTSQIEVVSRADDSGPAGRADGRADGHADGRADGRADGHAGGQADGPAGGQAPPEGDPAGHGDGGPTDDEFEAKLEAWVSEGARHFRRN